MLPDQMRTIHDVVQSNIKTMRGGASISPRPSSIPANKSINQQIAIQTSAPDNLVDEGFLTLF